MDSGSETINQTMEDVTAAVHSLRRPRRTAPYRSSRIYGDRFIPYRGARNVDIAQGLLTLPTKERHVSGIVTASKEAYRKILFDTMFEGRTRILSFWDHPSSSFNSLPDLSSSNQVQPVRKTTNIPQKPEDTLCISGIMSDYRLNLFDWGSNDMFAVALGNTVLLKNATSGPTSRLLTVSVASGPVTSISWSPDCRRIAIGLQNSNVLVYDPATSVPTRTFNGIHKSMVGSLAWNDCILTTGGADGSIINSDVRIKSDVVRRYHGHSDLVCGLKWSSSGNHLASGGTDGLLHIWDISKSNPLHRFKSHTAMVRALAWCPYERNILASGGGNTDNSIKFWDVSTGTCMRSVDTGSSVCSLLWNNNARELLSSHGHAKNHLALWKYPSMAQIAERIGHRAPVPYLALSPDGFTVASVSTDETMNLWHILVSHQRNGRLAPHMRWDHATCTATFDDKYIRRSDSR